MLFKVPPFHAAVILLVTLAMPAIAAHAQPPEHVVSKLDERLAAKVRHSDSTTERVIIRTTSEGVSGLTHALERGGHEVLRRHRIINALTARVPVEALQGLARLPFVESISMDAVVIADQTTSGDS